MTAGVRLIIMGRQGAGKGTQCQRISRHFVVPHISTGEILRAAVREGTEIGKMAKQVIEAGRLVGDEIMIEIIRERLEQDDARTRGYILDGFPRTVAQAQALDHISEVRPINMVIDLEVKRELVLSRLSARRVCEQCQANYVATGTEANPWTCAKCGGSVVQRADDTPEAINHRLDLYDAMTSPLVAYYKDQNKLAVVDGLGTPDEVFTRLSAAVASIKNR